MSHYFWLQKKSWKSDCCVFTRWEKHQTALPELTLGCETFPKVCLLFGRTTKGLSRIVLRMPKQILSSKPNRRSFYCVWVRERSRASFKSRLGIIISTLLVLTTCSYRKQRIIFKETVIKLKPTVWWLQESNRMQPRLSTAFLLMACLSMCVHINQTRKCVTTKIFWKRSAGKYWFTHLDEVWSAPVF